MVAEPAFTSTSEDWLFLCILRHLWYNTGIVCYIFPLFVSFCYFLLFFEDLAVIRIYRIKIYYKNSQFLFLVGFFMSLWPGGFFCCIFSLKFLLIFLLRFWRLSSLSFLSLGFIVLSLSHLSFLGYLTPSCVRFLNYFKEGKKHFIV